MILTHKVNPPILYPEKTNFLPIKIRAFSNLVGEEGPRIPGVKGSSVLSNDFIIVLRSFQLMQNLLSIDILKYFTRTPWPGEALSRRLESLNPSNYSNSFGDDPTIRALFKTPPCAQSSVFAIATTGQAASGGTSRKEFVVD